MKKEYIEPKFEVITFESCDVITTSGVTNGENDNKLPFVPF